MIPFLKGLHVDRLPISKDNLITTKNHKGSQRMFNFVAVIGKIALFRTRFVKYLKMKKLKFLSLAQRLIINDLADGDLIQVKDIYFILFLK